VMSTSTSPATSTTIGVVSDTHNTLPLWVVDAFKGACLDYIMHVGDIEHESILWELELIAPLIAVRGNCDFQPALLKLPTTKTPTMGNAQLIIAHKPNGVNAVLQKTRCSEVSAPYLLGIHGHTHVPHFTQAGVDTFVLCPGSPSEPRGGSAPSVAILTIESEDSTTPPVVRFINP